MTATFSARVREQFSPTVPQTMRPETPSRSSPSMTRCGRLDIEAEILAKLGRHRGKDAVPIDMLDHGTSWGTS